jgi:AAA domain
MSGPDGNAGGSRHGAHAQREADLVVQQLLEEAVNVSERSIRLVNAPAGAGKTSLVTKLIPAYVGLNRRVGIVTQTNEQADDLARRLANEQPDLPVARLVSGKYQPSFMPPNVRVTDTPVIAVGHGPVIATADKWTYSTEKLADHCFDVGLIDEAYQMPAGKLLFIGHMFEALELVGDPGQLSPFTTVETTRWANQNADPTRNVVDTLRRYRTLDTHNLPVTRRLPANAADLVCTAFYPNLQFAAATGPGERQLGANPEPLTTVPGRTVDMALATGWAMLTLPNRAVTPTDSEIAETIADVAMNLLTRNLQRTHDEHPNLPVDVAPERIAIGTAHRNQVLTVKNALQRRNITGVIVETANRLQGREFDVVIVWHPLSGRTDAASFHLDVGRLCVLLTRHRHACIVVTRAGTLDLLEKSIPLGDGNLHETNDRTITGWEAHLQVLDHLRTYEVHL